MSADPWIRPRTLEEAVEAIAKPENWGRIQFTSEMVLDLAERVIRLEQQVADLTELARTANRRPS